MLPATYATCAHLPTISQHRSLVLSKWTPVRTSLNGRLRFSYLKLPEFISLFSFLFLFLNHFRSKSDNYLSEKHTHRHELTTFDRFLPPC
jgi:hypothetical protein